MGRTFMRRQGQFERLAGKFPRTRLETLESRGLIRFIGKGRTLTPVLTKKGMEELKKRKKIKRRREQAFPSFF